MPRPPAMSGISTSASPACPGVASGWRRDPIDAVSRSRRRPPTRLPALPRRRIAGRLRIAVSALSPVRPSDGRMAVPPRFSQRRQIFLPPQATSPGHAATAADRPQSGPFLTTGRQHIPRRHHGAARTGAHPTPAPGRRGAARPASAAAGVRRAATRRPGRGRLRLPPRPTRMPVVIPRPAPPRRRPVLWLSVLFVLLVMAAAGSYLAITTPAGRAVRSASRPTSSTTGDCCCRSASSAVCRGGCGACGSCSRCCYRPTVNDFRTTTSVVVPSFREDPDVLELALDTWLGQDPDQVIVVLDVADTEAQRRLLARNDPRLRVIMFKHAGKRSALGRRHPRGTRRDPRADRLRHAVDRWPARERADAVRRPRGRRGEHAAERLPGRHQRLAPRRRVDHQQPLPRLRARDRPGRRRGVRLRPHRRLPAGASC